MSKISIAKTSRNKLDLTDKLNQYVKESVIINNDVNHWKYKGLLMLAPFVASMSVSDKIAAQACNTNAMSRLSIFCTVSTTCSMYPQALYFDADGDGNNDLKIFAQKNQRGTNPNATSYNFFIGEVTPPFPNPFKIFGFPSFGGTTTKFYASNLAYSYTLANIYQNTSGGNALIGGRKRINTSSYPMSVWPTYFPYGSSNRVLYTGGFINTNGTGSGFVGVSVGGSEGWINLSFSNGGTRLDVDGYGFEEMATTPDLKVGICPGIVPVEYISFEVNSKNGVHQLVWNTASEVNNQGFEIQRSLDGYNFESIGWVDGAGNSNNQEAYQYVDRSILPNITYYYRLKQVDFDGNNDYSDVISTIWEDKSSFTIHEVFPNPVKSQHFKVEIKSGIEESADFILFDQAGQKILNHKYQLAPGVNTISINTQHVPSGNYILKVLTNHHTEYKKVAITH